MSNYRRFNNRITNLWMSSLGKLNATQLGECDCLVVSGYNTQYYMFERKRLIEACKSLRVNESELLLIDLFISESK